MGQRCKFSNIEVSEDASKYVHCQRNFSPVLIHISHVIPITRNLSFWNPKNQPKTLSNTSSLASRNSVQDNRHQILNWRFHRNTNKGRWRFEKSMQRINCGLYCPCWLQTSYASYDIWHLLYAHCNTESTCVLPIILSLKIRTKLNYYNPTQNITSKTQLPSAVTIG